MPTKLTEVTRMKLVQFADNLLAGEEFPYKAWVDSGLSNEFQIYYNNWARKRFGGCVLASGSRGSHSDMIDLAFELAEFDSSFMVRPTVDDGRRHV